MARTSSNTAKAKRIVAAGIVALGVGSYSTLVANQPCGTQTAAFCQTYCSNHGFGAATGCSVNGDLQVIGCYCNGNLHLVY